MIRKHTVLDSHKFRFARQDQVQNRHKVALTATEAPMQIRCLTLVPKNGALDEMQRIIEGQH